MLENIYNMDILLLHKAHNVFSYVFWSELRMENYKLKIDFQRLTELFSI